MKTINLLTTAFLLTATINLKADDKQSKETANKKESSISISQPEIVWGAPEELNAMEISLLDLKLPEIVWGTPEGLKGEYVSEIKLDLPAMTWGSPQEAEELNSSN